MNKDQEMELKYYMAQEIAKGVSLSDIQKAANEKFGLKLTYMDIRIYASELENIDWDAHDPKAIEKAKAEAKKAEEEAKKAAEGAEGELPAGSGDGETVVEISKLVRPGAAISGSVKFASGVTAEWYLDQMGRLGLDAVKGGEPTKEDIAAFQQALQKEVEKMYGGR